VTRGSSLLLVLGAMALGALLLEPRLASPASFDATHSYLPMARELLARGWAYLHEEASLAYAPVAFAWPALLGAHETLVRHANIGLYCLSILFAYLSVRAIPDERAGLIAAFLAAICPAVRPFIADALTEAPYIFLIAAWILCIARVARGGGIGWILAGGLSFALAVLARPAAMYFAPLALVVLAWKRQWRLAALHAVASLLVGLWVLRNAIVFGFPAVAAGAGGALYFGVNPLVDGFDPPYYGMQFDSGIAQDSLSHLSIHGDRTLRAIGTLELLDTPLSVLIPMFAHKALSFLFVSETAYVSPDLPWLRAWRIAALVFAAIGFARHRRNAVVAIVGALVAYMVVVHIPLLYTHRYSVGALDFPLALLAATGISQAVRSAAGIAGGLMVSALAVGAGLVHATELRGSPMPDRVPTELAWEQDVDQVAVVGRAEHVDLDIPSSAGGPWDMTILELDLAFDPVPRARCETMLVRYRKLGQAAFDPWRVVRVPIQAGEFVQRYDIGATAPLGLDGPGTIRIEPECTGTVRVGIATASVLLSKRECFYAELHKARR